MLARLLTSSTATCTAKVTARRLLPGDSFAHYYPGKGILRFGRKDWRLESI